MSMFTAFFGDEAIASGEASSVSEAVRARCSPDEQARVRVFDDMTGQVSEYDAIAADAAPPRGRGRPKLGVVPREVTLLPRHWDWLAGQRGGASAALRRLVEDASRAEPGAEARRDAAYRFMADMCGDRPGYEEALRALYRGDEARLDALIADWPEDVRAYVGRLLGRGD
jgi:hypothetical protein